MSGFVLKLIAIIIMVIDHAGLMLFPQAEWMRIIGRVGFPIFAYFIAEGFRYTRSREKYILRIFGLGVVCQLGYAVTGSPLQFCILISFTFSLILMQLAEQARFSLTAARNASASADVRHHRAECLLYAGGFLAVLVSACFFCDSFWVDYELAGILLPVFVSFFRTKWGRLGGLALGIGFLCCEVAIVGDAPIEWFSFLSLILIAFYNGKPGKHRMKYFFYLFYPLHLMILAGLAVLFGTMTF